MQCPGPPLVFYAIDLPRGLRFVDVDAGIAIVVLHVRSFPCAGNANTTYRLAAASPSDCSRDGYGGRCAGQLLGFLENRPKAIAGARRTSDRDTPAARGDASSTTCASHRSR